MGSMEIDGGSVVAPARQALEIDGGAQARPKAAPRPRTVAREGPWSLSVVIAVEGAPGREGAAVEVPAAFRDGARRLLGFAVARWVHVAVHDELAGSEALQPLLTLARRKTRRPPAGYLVQELADMLGFEEPPVLSQVDVDAPSRLLEALSASTGRLRSRSVIAPSVSVNAALAEWEASWGGLQDRGCHAILLDPGFASSYAGARFLWAVALCPGRLPRAVEFAGLRPSNAVLRRQVASAAPAPDAPAQAARPAQPTSRYLGDAFPVDMLVEWIDATSDLHDMRDAAKSKKKWAKILARGGHQSAEELCNRTKDVSYPVLQRSRTQLDATAMVLFRFYWDSIAGSQADVFVYTDGSPQWRGSELFATSMDVITRGPDDARVYDHFLLPVVQLGINVRTSIAKGFALLWQLFLLLGPDMQRLRSFLLRIRSITTDFGVEHMVQGLPDLLPEFLVWATGKAPGGVTSRTDRMFPRALLSPGWAHLCDSLLQRALFALDWFPSWLDAFKAFLTFLRHHSEDLILSLNRFEEGRIVGEMLAATSFPYFAQWRWGTLADACEAVANVHRPFARVYSRIDFLLKLKDQKILRKIDVVVHGELWSKRAVFVRWMASEVTRLQRFGRTCLCHEAGDEEECHRVGRVLPAAMKKVEAAMHRWTAASAEWVPATFLGIPFEEVDRFKGTVAVLKHFTLEKFEFLNSVPYLLVRLGEEGVVGRCFAQWDAAAPDAHHPVTRDFFTPGGWLRRDMERLRDTGHTTPELQREVDGLCDVPLDDSTCESPHAKARRFWLGTRAAKFPWVAASMRLRQNLRDVERFQSLPAVDLQEAWNKWSSVLQPKPGVYRCRKLPRKTVLKQIYYVSKLVDLEGCARVLGDDDPPPPEHPAPQEENAAQEGDAVEPPRPFATEDQKLMDAWLAASLNNFTYVSVTTETLEGKTFHYYKLLSKRTKVFRLQPVSAVGHVTQGDWLWQPLEVTGDAGRNELVDEVCVFVAEASCRSCPSVICGSNPLRRGEIKVWRGSGCPDPATTILKEPTPLKFTGSLFGDAAPPLALLDELARRGFAPQRGAQVHLPNGVRIFDGRHPSSSRAYLQCLLNRAKIFAKGQAAFPSGKSQAWYRLLLKSTGPVDENISAKEAQRLLTSLGEGEAMAPEPEAPPVPGPPLALPMFGGMEIDGGLPLPPPPPGAPAPEPPPPAPEGPPLAPLEDQPPPAALEIDAGQAPPAPEGPAGPWPEFIYGRKVTVERKRNQFGLRVSCWKHNNCKKYRSTRLQTNRYGPRAAEFFLTAWQAHAEEHVENHGAWDPSPAQIQAVADAA